MKNNIKTPQVIKSGLHPRNRHNTRYDFPELIKSNPELSRFVAKNKYNDESIDFSNPEAVRTLNQALLKYFYSINFWEIPKNFLCPPIPGRADYIHQIADVLGINNNGVIPKGSNIRILDIGVGANCIYPIIGNFEYQWQFIGTDIDPEAISSANKIISSNNLENSIQTRLQLNSQLLFKGIINKDEYFDITISNPPFHSSLEMAAAENSKKNHNLNRNKKNNKNLTLNFGGMSNELWCEGGEVSFVSKMIDESLEFKSNCLFFTSLISKSTTLPILYQKFKELNIQNFKTIDMAQGQKKSRLIMWTFQTPKEQKEWREKR